MFFFLRAEKSYNCLEKFKRTFNFCWFDHLHVQLRPDNKNTKSSSHYLSVIQTFTVLGLLVLPNYFYFQMAG